MALTGNKPAGGAAIKFTENKGQVSDQYFKPRTDVLFSGSDNKLAFHLKQTGISYQLSSMPAGAASFNKPSIAAKSGAPASPCELRIYRLDINWHNCNGRSIIEKGEALDGYDNFYTEACPGGATGVKSYGQLVYRQLYEGVDLKWYEHNGHLKYDYEVAAGADYSRIEWEIEGAEGISIDQKGNLVVKTPLGSLVEEAPLVMQAGRRLDAGWRITGNKISFAIRGADPSKSLVIDPLVRLWGTYYGGGQEDFYALSCVDGSDNVFITGGTSSIANIATVGSHQLVYAGPGNLWFPGDGFIAKFNAQGVRQWATYYGGSGSDYSNYCTADASGNVYMVGGTSTSNTAVMATPGCFQPTLAGSSDGFIVKFNASGIRQWGTYYGDTLVDWVLGVSIDPGGNLFVCGASWAVSGNTVFATPGAYQPQHASSSGQNTDGFLAKFTSSGARLWSTYYGGSPEDAGYYCKADNSGNVYMTGVTSTPASSIIATSGCHQYTNGGYRDAFLVKFSGTGSRLWGTYYGGDLDDYAISCELDNYNNVYMAGSTASQAGIATPGSHQSSYVSGRDVFLVKFNTSGVRQWGTYYGGSGIEDWGFCAADSKGDIYLSGVTGSASGTVIATACSYQPAYGGGPADSFLAKFSTSGGRLWGTYYGGAGNEDFTTNYGGWGPSVTIDGQDNVFFGGSTTTLSNAQTMAGTGGHQPAFGGGPSDVYLVKFDGCRGIVAPPASSLTVCFGKTATLSTVPSCATYWYSGATGNNLLFPGTLYTGAITSDTTFYAEDLLCGPGLPRTPVTITVIPAPTIYITASSATVCAGESVTLIASGALSYSWSVPSAAAYSAVVSPSTTTTYSVSGLGGNGCERTATIAIVAQPCTGIGNNGRFAASLFIYPNPNAGEFTISTDKNSSIIMVSSLGQTVRTLALSEANAYKAEVAGLASGMYYIQAVQDGSTTTMLQKIIVINR